MQIKFPKLNFKLFIIPLVGTLMILISTGLMYLFGFKTFEQIQDHASKRIVLLAVETFLAVSVIHYILKVFNKKFPWEKSWIFRFFLDTMVVFCMGAIMAYYFNDRTTAAVRNFLPPNMPLELSFIMPVIMNTLFVSVVELILLYENHANMNVKIAIMEKERINSAYSALKQQLDHHFLFNNLSVLSSLIYEDVDKADDFIQDFSKVYRYVLQINDRDLVTVEEELDFIDAYLYLFKSRFECGFEYRIDDMSAVNQRFLPPLTLQVLVENAIKHNEVSKQNPLHIRISHQDGLLSVSNNHQPKMEDVYSTKTGLRNLTEKFNLLNTTAPTFKLENKAFIARIPLIEADHD